MQLVPATMVPRNVTLEVDDSSDILEEWSATSLSVYYGGSAALIVLILSREARKKLASPVVTGDDRA